MTTDRASLPTTKTILLTSRKRDGTAVSTPVSIAFHRDRAFFRTYDKAGKAKRLRNNPLVEVAPASFLGKVRGPAVRASAALLTGEEARLAARTLGRRHRLLHGIAVPVLHRLKHYQTMHYELHPQPGPDGLP